MNLHRSVALALLLAMSACGRSTPPPTPTPARTVSAAAVVAPPAPPPPPATLTLEEFSRQRMAADEEGHEAYFARCCTPAERSANPVDHPLPAAEREALVARVVAEIGAKVQAGVQRFDGAQAAACVVALRRSRGPAPTECIGPDPFSVRGVLEDSIPSCRNVLVGTAAVGARCAGSDECVPTAYCARASWREATGLCTARVEHGADCRVSVDSCPRGDECVLGRCRARLAIGASCELPTDCARSARCNDAHFCVRRAFAADGAPCTDNADCQSDHCAEGRCQPFCSGRPAP